MYVASMSAVRRTLLGLTAVAALLGFTTAIVHAAVPVARPATAVAAKGAPAPDGWLPGG
jgi:hypothetical protein